MKTAYWIGAAVVAIIIVVLAVKLVGSSAGTPEENASSTNDMQTMSTSSMSGMSASDQTNTATPATNGAPATSAAAPAAQHFTVNGNDATADLKTITVAAGTPVSITFGADAGTTYHGGLDFRSSVVNTGTIAPGSTKTISFTATKSFAFTPYWPATNIAKPYTINVVVR